MEHAFAWIGKFAEFIASWLPRLLVVQATHRAVKYVNGWKVVELKPGRHIYWPIMTPIETCAVVRQVLNLPTQILETKDGVPVAAGVVIEYTIENAVRFLAECENGYEAVGNIAMAALRQIVISHNYEDLRGDGHELDTLLTRATQGYLTAYGVRVKKTRLSDCARVRPLHITGGNSSNPVKEIFEHQ